MSVRNALFQTHWLLGITAGLVLALMGVTGSLLSFEDEITRALNPALMQVPAQDRPMLGAPELVRRVAEADPRRRIGTVSLSSVPGRSARVGFLHEEMPGENKKRERGARQRMDVFFVDPYDGHLLGTEDSARSHGFLHFAEDLHRRLAAGDRGKLITGACAIVLLWLSLTGLYLRWPRRVSGWRTWLLPRWRLRARPFLVSLHSVVGTWVLVCYLVSTLTGLFFAFDWYRQGVYALAGAPPAERLPPPAGANLENLPDLSAAWTAFLAATRNSGYSTASFNLPASDQPLLVTYLDADPPHERAANRITLDLATGEVRSHDRYAAKTAGGKLVASMFTLHRGSFFGVPGIALMMLSSIGMPLFAITGWMQYLKRRGQGRAKDVVAVASAV